MESIPDPLGGPSAAIEEDLLRRVAGGDGAAFGTLAERLGPRLRRVISRLGLDPAETEDALQ